MNHKMTRRFFLQSTALSAGTVIHARSASAQPAQPIHIPDLTIKSITYCRYETSHPRIIGRNSVNDHPRTHQVPIVRVATDGSIEGVGDHLDQRTVGKKLSDLLTVVDGYVDLHPGADSLTSNQQAVLLDILGKALQRPAYELLGPVVRTEIDMYDGTIYMRDLDGGWDLWQRDIEDGAKAGHTAFKLKVGRGRWTTRPTGLKADIEAVKRARRVIGQTGRILVDANNAYTIQDAIELLKQVGDQRIFMAEELFSEAEAESYRRLTDFVSARRYKTLLADGEGSNGRGELMSRIEDRTVTVAQPDIRDIGLLQYRAYAKEVAGFRASVAPHTWPKQIGTLEAVLLATVTPNFLIAEDCRLSSDLVQITGYTIGDGKARLTKKPGMGIEIDEDVWRKRYAGQAKTVS
jgi:L-alanine-DL-glutamate epimerase-like enolase superfamily enzyme